MDETTTQKPKLRDFVILNDDPEAPSLLNTDSGHVFVINNVGRRIIELADGTRSIEAIAADITGQFKGASDVVVRKEIDEFLQETAKKGLTTWV